MPQTKIATCCYCGTRAALVLAGERQHHLSCSSCGAPLSRIKHLKAEAAPAPATAPVPVRPVRPASPSMPPRPLKAKKKKSKGRKIWGEVFDLIEDIFD